MIPGMNPRQMRQMMKKMGIAQQEIEATEVIIKTAEKTFVFINPQVSRVNMMGQDTFQVVGEHEEHSVDTSPEIIQDDVQTVMDQANVDEETAKKAIEVANGDLAEAIMSFQED